MEKKIISIEGAPPPIGPYSQGVVSGNMVFLSGQICIDPVSGQLNNTDVETETRQVMHNISQLLSAEGIGFENIVKASIFLKNLNDFEKVNAIYSGFLKAPYPARECVEVSRLPKDVNVEISVIASLV